MIKSHRNWYAVIALCMAITTTASADIVTQFSFENDLLDTAGLGASADHLTATPLSGALNTTYEAGIVGQAIRISADPGAATVLSAPSSADLNLAPSYTIEAFVKPDFANTGEWDRFVTKWFDGGNQYHWSFRFANNGQDLFMNGGPVINGTGTGTVPLNLWSHVAMTGDPVNGTRLWQDGVVVGSAGYVAPTAGGDTFRIGNRAPTDVPLQFSGLVDELLIHNTSQDETYMLARAGLIAPPPPPGADPPPATGLLSYFSFDQNTNDEASLYANNVGVSNDNLAPRGGGVNIVPGLNGGALSIGVGGTDATDLAANHSPDISLPSQYTIEAWINPSDLTGPWQRIALQWGAGGTAYHFAIRDLGGRQTVSLFHGEAGGGQPNANGGNVVLNEWQHIAGVADGSFLIVYLNGEEVNRVPYDGTIANITEGLGLGDSFSSLSGIKFNGLIDDLAFWGVPLTPEQIRYHYQQGGQGLGLTIPSPSAGIISLAMLSTIAMRRRRAAN